LTCAGGSIRLTRLLYCHVQCSTAPDRGTHSHYCTEQSPPLSLVHTKQQVKRKRFIENFITSVITTNNRVRNWSLDKSTTNIPTLAAATAHFYFTLNSLFLLVTPGHARSNRERMLTKSCQTIVET